jgi:Collagen triple helix repeat (20 copies)
MRRRFSRVTLAITTVAIVAIAGGVTYAVADIGGGGVIHGCYKSQNGQLRLIDPAMDSCNPSETAISWSQTGPQGPPGPKGATGPQGVTGRQGAMGPKGATGPQGATGQQGARGPQGPGTKTISGAVGGNGVAFIGTGFSSSRTGVGTYVLSFPAGTWSPPNFPMVVVTAFQSGASFPIGRVTFLTAGPNGSGSAGISFGNPATSAAIDTAFVFNASAPLSGTSSPIRPGMQRATLKAPVRSRKHGRKGH